MTQATSSKSSRALTQASIAELAGVSRWTVNRAIQDDAAISMQTRERVHRLVREHGYQTNHLARALSKRRTMLLGLLMPNFVGRYSGELFKAMDQTARVHGYYLLLSSPGAWQDEVEEIRRLLKHRVDALVLYMRVPRRLRIIQKEIESSSLPIVTIGDYVRQDRPTVSHSDRNDAITAIQHLIALGHSQIFHLVGSRTSRSAIERCRGYRHAMEAAGLEHSKQTEAVCQFNTHEAREAVGRWLDRDDPPTAIYAASDSMAAGALLAAEDRTVAVPGELAIVGHGDDVIYPDLMRTALTTIRHDLEGLAGAAVETALARLNDEQPPALEQFFPGRLIVRDSCGAKSASISCQCQRALP